MKLCDEWLTKMYPVARINLTLYFPYEHNSVFSNSVFAVTLRNITTLTKENQM